MWLLGDCQLSLLLTVLSRVRDSVHLLWAWYRYLTDLSWTRQESHRNVFQGILFCTFCTGVSKINTEQSVTSNKTYLK